MKIQTLSLIVATLLISPVLAQAQVSQSNRVPVHHMEPQYGSTSAVNDDSVIVLSPSSPSIKSSHHVTPR